MGAVFYYQATAVYMSEDQIGNAVNNETIVPGEGTAMEHHWDEAFGYWGVPLDFPGNLAGLRYFGEYTAQRNAYLKCSKPLMDAFILGRSAISNKDMDTKNAQVPIIRSWWEKVVAACAIHYLNTAKTNIGDDALRNHQLSEAWGFIYMLKYNPAKTISQTQIDALIQNLGGNFYTINGSTIDSVRDQLSTIFQMDAIKSLL